VYSIDSGYPIVTTQWDGARVQQGRDAFSISIKTKTKKETPLGN
jgi:hypothetical protein